MFGLAQLSVYLPHQVLLTGVSSFMDGTSFCSVGRFDIAAFVNSSWGSETFRVCDVRHARTSKVKTTSLSSDSHVCRIRTEIEALLSACGCNKQCDRPHFDVLMFLL